MVTPDSIIESFGEQVTLTRAIDYTTGRDGVTGVTREFETVKGIVSSPGEEAEQRLEGRLESGMITVTVPSGTDVKADREGGRDRLVRPAVADPTDPPEDARLYTVEDVTRDRHPLTGVDKLTLMCSEYGGREDLEIDAETYVEA